MTWHPKRKEMGLVKIPKPVVANDLRTHPRSQSSFAHTYVFRGTHFRWRRPVCTTPGLRPAVECGIMRGSAQATRRKRYCPTRQTQHVVWALGMTAASPHPWQAHRDPRQNLCVLRFASIASFGGSNLPTRQFLCTGTPGSTTRYLVLPTLVVILVQRYQTAAVNCGSEQNGSPEEKLKNALLRSSALSSSASGTRAVPRLLRRAGARCFRLLRDHAAWA
eukprot:3067128-Rhodomonas_salina.4